MKLIQSPVHHIIGQGSTWLSDRVSIITSLLTYLSEHYKVGQKKRDRAKICVSESMSSDPVHTHVSVCFN